MLLLSHIKFCSKCALSSWIEFWRESNFVANMRCWLRFLLRKTRFYSEFTQNSDQKITVKARSTAMWVSRSSMSRESCHLGSGRWGGLRRGRHRASTSPVAVRRFEKVLYFINGSPIILCYQVSTIALCWCEAAVECPQMASAVALPWRHLEWIHPYASLPSPSLQPCWAQTAQSWTVNNAGVLPLDFQFDFWVCHGHMILHFRCAGC